MITTIDKEKSYTVDNYTFKNFVMLDETEKRMIWEWRNDERISKWMRNQEIIPYENHLKFIENLKNREDVYYWLVFCDSEAVGVFDIIDVDFEKREVEPGYYLNPELIGSGNGLNFNYYVRAFTFNVLNFEFVKGRIIAGNDNAFLISSFFKITPNNIVTIDGNKYVAVKGNKSDFNKISKKTLLRDFVKSIPKNGVDWDNIITKLENE